MSKLDTLSLILHAMFVLGSTIFAGVLSFSVLRLGGPGRAVLVGSVSVTALVGLLSLGWVALIPYTHGRLIAGDIALVVCAAGILTAMTAGARMEWELAPQRGRYLQRRIVGFACGAVVGMVSFCVFLFSWRGVLFEDFFR